MTAEYDHARAIRLLKRRDPVLGAIITRQGACGLAAAQRTDHFLAIVRAIVYQQLSTKAAGTIYSRLAALFHDNLPTAAGLTALSDEKLRAAGLSAMKVRYLRDLAAKVIDGTLRLDALDTMSDDEVIAELTKVKGIGRWSAEMFLMFRLSRPDVLPVGDLGIARAIQKAYGLRKLPAPKRIVQIGSAWKPYRSIACWYLWASLRNR
jgi:DNA-3-methyladenine glycosylase II